MGRSATFSSLIRHVSPSGCRPCEEVVLLIVTEPGGPDGDQARTPDPPGQNAGVTLIVYFRLMDMTSLSVALGKSWEALGAHPPKEAAWMPRSGSSGWNYPEHQKHSTPVLPSSTGPHSHHILGGTREITDTVYTGRASQSWRGAGRPIKAVTGSQFGPPVLWARQKQVKTAPLSWPCSWAGFSAPHPPVPSRQTIPSKPG